jgi:hypothetical protein
MITREIVRDKLMSYLNEQISLAQLVDWAEKSFIDGWFEPDEDILLLRDIMAYLAAADTSAFPLTWDVCLDFMKRLGLPVRVVPISVAS